MNGSKGRPPGRLFYLAEKNEEDNLSSMRSYRLRLFAGNDMTQVQFTAERDSDAAAAATAIFQACSDVCDSFEVRRDAYWIAGMGKPYRQRELRLEELAARTQEVVIETEEALVQSESMIARSKLLLERTDRAHRVVRWRRSDPTGK